MSRFEEVVNEAIGEVVLSESPFRAETLAQHIAELVRERQGAQRAEVTHRGALPRAQAGARLGRTDAGDLHAARPRRRLRARHAAHGRRLGHGHDRLPVRAGARRRARRASAWPRTASREEQIERVLERVPVATHNQRGLGTLHIGCIEDCDAEIDATTLLAIVEASMSSEIYELMKRSDEVEVVEKAHRRPRFVEDCVREMIAGVIERLPRAGRRELRLGAPGEPRDDPPAQRRGRAPRPALRAARGARLGRARAASDELREWLDRGRRPASLTAAPSALGFASLAPAACDGAGRRSSRGPRAP